MSEMSKLAATVLCGGKGTRMGGVNKGLVSYQNQPLFKYACDNLTTVASQIYINSNSEKATYQQKGYTVIDDGDYPYQGPLSGIYAGLCLPFDYVAFAPCDQLALPGWIYPTLLAKAVENGAAAYARGVDDVYPTCSVIAAHLRGSVKQCLDNGQLRLRAWMKENAEAVHFDDVDFANVNQLPS